MEIKIQACIFSLIDGKQYVPIYLANFLMVLQLFCSMCSAFVLQILKSTFETRKAGIGNKYSGLINFGEFKV